MNIELPVQFEPQLVNKRRQDLLQGEVDVPPDEFFRHFILADGMAICYGVGVGCDRLCGAGTFTLKRKPPWPWWRPTRVMIR